MAQNMLTECFLFSFKYIRKFSIFIIELQIFCIFIIFFVYKNA